jgi:hypothetical protein
MLSALKFIYLPFCIKVCGIKVCIAGNYYFEKLEAGKLPEYEVIDGFTLTEILSRY